MKSKFLVLITVFCYAFKSNAQINKEALMTLFDYSKIKFNASLLGDGIVHPHSDIEKKDAQNIISNVPQTFSINNVAIPLIPVKILKQAITSMKGLANDIATCQNSIPSVEIFYGVRSNTLTLYYTPVLLCLAGDKYGQGGVRYGHYTKISSGQYYLYTENNVVFTSTTAAAVSTATLAYQAATGIKVKRPAGDVNTFQNSQDIMGDVRSILYPIEQIERICDSDDMVYIWNAAQKIRILTPSTNPPTTDLTKHILVLSSKQATVNNTTISIEIDNAALRFGDLGHICPPSCYTDDFTFIMGTPR